MTYSQEIPDLTIEHYGILKNSAITDEVIKERGYRSIVRVARPSKSAAARGEPTLQELGFFAIQQKPGLLIPLHGAAGDIAGYQLRPDKPRMDNKRDPPRAIKYENPKGSKITIDVPPRCLPQIGNPAIPLFFTEGIKKADSLASYFVCAVGLIGVWGFISTNDWGAATISNDLGSLIALDKRICYIVYDSDVMTKHEVRQALERLTDIIKRKGGLTRILNLPAGNNGEKTGVDDFFVRGHTIEDLIATEGDPLPAARAAVKFNDNDEFNIADGRFCYLKYDQQTKDFVPAPLCNFRSYVTDEIYEDDGMETKIRYKIRGLLHDNTALKEITVDQSEFDSLTWKKHWGIKTIIKSGSALKDKLRECIQHYSKENVRIQNIYTHTGWRTIGSDDIYLSGSGAIGNDKVFVHLPEKLLRYSIPVPQGDAADPVAAFKTSLDFLDVADITITLPLWSAMFLSPLCSVLEPDFSIFMYGSSGSYKSVLSALALCHYGYFDYLHLPTNWSGTANALEYLCFCLKDTPIIIDDWAPGSDTAEAKSLEQKAHRIFRAQGNLQGRDRMAPNTMIQNSYTPRGLIITTAEQIPNGQSINARLFCIKAEKYKTKIDEVTRAQGLTRYYRAAMYYYIDYLSKEFKDKTNKAGMIGQRDGYRQKALKESEHPRLPTSVANLYMGLTCGLNCALKCKAIDKKYMDKMTVQGWEILNALANEQSARTDEERAGKRFLEAIRAVIRKGNHILKDVKSTLDTNENKDVMADNEFAPKNPAPGQSMIGWKDAAKGYVYLDPLPSYQAVVQFYKSIDEPFTYKHPAAFEDLKRLGYTKDNIDSHNTARAWINGQTVPVLKFDYTTIFPYKE